MPFLKLCATYIDVISILLHYWVHELHTVLHMCVGNARVHVCMLQISKRMPLHAVDKLIAMCSTVRTCNGTVHACVTTNWQYVEPY